MILKEICLLASDTTRTRAYLTALFKNNLIPSLVLLLPQNKKKDLPGMIKRQKYFNDNFKNDEWEYASFDLNMDINLFLNSNSIKYKSLPNHDINNSENIRIISSLAQNIIIYSGYGGFLLKKNILSTGKNFLHVHGGYLPQYKGSTTNYYSLILEGKLGASSILLNEKIDSGPILLRQKFSPPPNLINIDHIFDSAARSKVLIDTLKEYLIKKKLVIKDYFENSETFYIVHPILKHLAILRDN